MASTIVMADALRGFSRDVKGCPSEAGLSALMKNVAVGTTRQNSEESLGKAREQFTKALNDLQQRPQTATRYQVIGELASTMIGFGGSDEQANARVRFAWQPGTQGGKFGMGQKTFTVLEELRKPLEQAAAQAEPDFKFLLARRLTRELTRKGQEAFAADLLPLALFAEPEKDEARAVVALEIYRVNKNSDVPRKVAEALKARIEAELKAKTRTINWNPYPASAQILCDAVGIDFKPLSLPQGNAGVSDNIRFAFTGTFLKGTWSSAGCCDARTGRY